MARVDKKNMPCNKPRKSPKANKKKVVKCKYCNREDGTCGCANKKTNEYGDDDWATPSGE